MANLAIAKASLVAGFMRSDPVPLAREELVKFHELLDTSLQKCTSQNIQRCKEWLLRNNVQSTARGDSLGKYLKALSSNLSTDKKSGTSSRKQQLHILYLVNDLLHHLRWHERDAKGLESFVNGTSQHLLSCLSNAAAYSVKAFPRHNVNITRLMAEWEENEYFSPSTVTELRDAVSNARKNADTAKSVSSTSKELLTKKEAPWVMPATHGDPTGLYHEIPAANMLPHIIPNVSIPINPHQMKALQFVPGPAEPALVEAVKSFLKDVEILYSTSYTEDEAIFMEMDDLGQNIIRDKQTGDVLSVESYYGWSKEFCEKMKKKHNPRQRSRERSDSRGLGRSQSPRKRRRYESDSSHSRSRSRNRDPSRSRVNDQRRSRSRSISNHRPRISQPGFSDTRRPRSYSRSRSRSQSRSMSRSRSPPRRFNGNSIAVSNAAQTEQVYLSPPRQTYKSSPTVSMNFPQPGVYPNSTQQIPLPAPPPPGSGSSQQQSPPPPPPPQHSSSIPQLQSGAYSNQYYNNPPIPPPRPMNWNGPWPPPPPLQGAPSMPIAGQYGMQSGVPYQPPQQQQQQYPPPQHQQQYIPQQQYQLPGNWQGGPPQHIPPPPPPPPPPAPPAQGQNENQVYGSYGYGQHQNQNPNHGYNGRGGYSSRGHPGRGGR